MVKILLAMFSLSGCHTTGKVVGDHDELKTIAVFTGSVFEDNAMYKRDFEDAANKACPKGYSLIERSRKPATLKVHERHEFYWVVQCRSDGKK